MIDTNRIEYIANLLKAELGPSYLMGFTNKTFVMVFKPGKSEAIKSLLKTHSESFGGICFYYPGYSVAFWEDVTDVLGFKNKRVCCVEFFEGREINREFYWRA